MQSICPFLSPASEMFSPNLLHLGSYWASSLTAIQSFVYVSARSMCAANYPVEKNSPRFNCSRSEIQMGASFACAHLIILLAQSFTLFRHFLLEHSFFVSISDSYFQFSGILSRRCNDATRLINSLAPASIVAHTFCLHFLSVHSAAHCTLCPFASAHCSQSQ